MSLLKRKPSPTTAKPLTRTPHPDAAVEVRLQKIWSLMRMRDECHDQISIYLSVIKRSHAKSDEAVANHTVAVQRMAYIPESQMTSVVQVNDRRASDAEARIREQRELIVSLTSQIDDIVAGTSDFDLSYLQPGVRRDVNA